MIALGVLFIGIVLEGTVLAKAVAEVLHESGQEKAGIASIPKAFTYLNRAKPATKLVLWKI